MAEAAQEIGAEERAGIVEVESDTLLEVADEPCVGVDEAWVRVTGDLKEGGKGHAIAELLNVALGKTDKVGELIGTGEDVDLDGGLELDYLLGELIGTRGLERLVLVGVEVVDDDMANLLGNRWEFGVLAVVGGIELGSLVLEDIKGNHHRAGEGKVACRAGIWAVCC